MKPDLKRCRIPIIIFILVIFARTASATTYWASPSGGAGTCAAASGATDPKVYRTLSQGLACLSAGDTLILKNGTYAANNTINGNNGTNGSKITVKAENRHLAIISSAVSCGAGESTPNAFDIQRQWYIIEGFDVSGMCIGMILSAANNEVRHNIIEKFNRWGIWVAANTQNIHHNLVSGGYGTSANADWAGISLTSGVSDNIIQANWIYSLGNRRFLEPCCGQNGVGVLFAMGANNNLLKGNVFLDITKTVGTRIFGSTTGGCLQKPNPSCPQTKNNIIRDNIILFGQGGGVGPSENASHNTITNNFFSVFESGIAAKGNDPGLNIFTHNTIVATPFSYSGFSLECGAEVGFICSRASTVTNNLFYGPSVGSNKLVFVQNFSDSVASANYNLIWRAGTTSNWVSGYTFGANDIHATGSQPIFANETTGDFRLAPTSPGKSAGSDGADMGAIFNADLRIDWLQYLWQLPTQEKSVVGQTGTSFTVTSGKTYQVWAYIKESSPFTGTEQFTVEGVAATSFSMGDALFWVAQAPQRYIYITTRGSDGTLNVSWNNSNSFDKIFIREMPTPAEAYSWIAKDPHEAVTQTITAPSNVTVTIP